MISKTGIIDRMLRETILPDIVAIFEFYNYCEEKLEL